MRLVSAPVIHAAGAKGAIESISAIFVLSKVTSLFISFCLELDAVVFPLVQEKVKSCRPVNITVTMTPMVSTESAN